MLPSKAARPRDLREALTFAFVHRTGARWRAGTSAILGLAYEPASGGAGIVDVRDVADFHTVQRDRAGVAIGAFVGTDALVHEPALTAALGDVPLAAHDVHFRLSALGAQVLIAGPGATRSTALESFAGAPLPPHEIPVAIRLPAAPPAVWFGNRRIKRRDGAASFELRVHVALTLAGAHRVARATVAHSVDGGPPLPIPTVASQLCGSTIGRSTFGNAARAGADVFRGDDERTNVLRRTVVPLLLSALNDAYASARAART